MKLELATLLAYDLAEEKGRGKLYIDTMADDDLYQWLESWNYKWIGKAWLCLA